MTVSYFSLKSCCKKVINYCKTNDNVFETMEHVSFNLNYEDRFGLPCDFSVSKLCENVLVTATHFLIKLRVKQAGERFILCLTCL